MSVNIEALIDNLGRAYQEIFDAGLISYKKSRQDFRVILILVWIW